MKIINNTQNKIYYQVTPSGTVLSGSRVIASGYLDRGTSLEFPVPDAGVNPIVYVRGAGNYNPQGNLSLHVPDGHADVKVSMTDVEI